MDELTRLSNSWRRDGGILRRQQQQQSLPPSTIPPVAGLPPNPNPSGGLIDYWRKLRANWKVVALTAAAGLACGFLWSRMVTPVYRGRASIEVFQKTGTEVPVDAVPNEAFVRTQIKILESESLYLRAAKRLNPKPTDILPESPGWLEQLRTAAFGRRTDPPTAEEWAGIIGGGLKVRSPDETRMVELTYDSPNRDFCTAVLAAVVEEYRATTVQTREGMTAQTSSWLAEQLTTMRRNLQASETNLLEFAKKNNLVLLGEKDSVAEETLRQLQGELAKAEADEVTKRSAQDIAASRPAASLPQVLDSPTLTSYRLKLQDLKQQFAEVSKTFTPEHYKYERLAAQIKEIEESIQREGENILKRVQNDYEAADSRRRMLVQRYAAQVESVSRQSQALAQFNLLKREVETNREVYEATLKRARDYGIQSVLHANHVRIIDDAKTPGLPHYPSKTWSLGLGVLAGLIAGIAMVLAKQTSIDTFQSPGEAGALIGTPELGVIPSTIPASRRRLLGRSVPYLERWSDSEFPADSFRSTLASILYARNQYQQLQTLVVTSALPREGKTTSTSHLGIALAEAGERVLIIDADTRKPHMHDLFGLPNERGLSDLLAEFSISDPSNYIQRTQHPLLHLLPAGPPAISGSLQVLYSQQWPQLMKTLRACYDMILIDSPPLLHLADSRRLGKLADALVLVIRANQTPRDAVLLARQRLDEDGITLLGAILNGWRAEEAGYGGYTPYKYQQRAAND